MKAWRYQNRMSTSEAKKVLWFSQLYYGIFLSILSDKKGKSPSVFVM
jgi:hypothetical protein